MIRQHHANRMKNSHFHRTPKSLYDEITLVYCANVQLAVDRNIGKLVYFATLSEETLALNGACWQFKE